MAEFGVLNDAFLSIAAVDLSDHVREVRLPRGVEALDDTVMGDNTRSEGAGLLTWGLTATFTQDYAAGSVDATMNTNLGTVVAVVLRPDSAAVSATNPESTGNMLLKSYDVIAGAVGDHLECVVELGAAGDYARAVSA